MRSIMRMIDVLLAFPGVLLAIVIISVLGPGLTNAIIAVAVYTIPIFARLARGSTLVVKDEPYVEAARAAGLSDLRILSRHIFPNISATLFVMMTLRVAISILTAASLSFLGLGAQAPLPEWGAMLSNSRNAMLIAPHVALFPGLAIILLVFGLNLFQDGLRQVLDPETAGPLKHAAQTPMPTSRRTASAFLAELFTLLRQPSISTRNEGMNECAALLAGQMRDVGIDDRDHPDAAPSGGLWRAARSPARRPC